MILILSFFTSCNSNNKDNTVKEGTYILEQSGTIIGAVMTPRITISGNDISFTYDLLSSYFPTGDYKMEEDILTMITHDKLYKYVFRIEEDKLVFLKSQSSEVKLVNDRHGVKIIDQAQFKLINN